MSGAITADRLRRRAATWLAEEAQRASKLAAEQRVWVDGYLKEELRQRVRAFRKARHG